MRIDQSIGTYADEMSDLVALIEEGVEITYGGLDERANRVANGLKKLGVGVGDRVSLISENSINQVLVYIAASKLGAVTVPMNYRLAPPELAFIVEDAQSKAVFVLGEQFIPVVRDAPLSAGFDVPIFSVGDTLPDGWTGWDAWIDNQSPEPVDYGTDDTAPVIQLYTSGTTGNPKGAVLSHLNFNFITGVGMDEQPREPGEKILIIAPMFHIGGCGSIIIALNSGATIIIERAFDPIRFVDAIEKHGLKNVFLVPAMLQAILSLVPDCRERDFSNLEQIVYGASPIPEGLLREAMEVFGCDFAQAYGMTETCGVISLLTPDDHRLALESRPELLTSCGKPVDGVEMDVVDPDGNSMAPGELGEIIVKSPSNMSGYWHLEAQTKDTIRDGWVHTGDAGFRSDDGYYFLRDRIKDVVISGGENIYPLEVERVLVRHEAVADVAVIGVPDKTYGEALLAVVVRADGKQISVDDMIAHCRGQLAGFKIPRQLETIDVLPRNASGKILKKDLREMFPGAAGS